MLHDTFNITQCIDVGDIRTRNYSYLTTTKCLEATGWNLQDVMIIRDVFKKCICCSSFLAIFNLFYWIIKKIVAVIQLLVCIYAGAITNNVKN